MINITLPFPVSVNQLYNGGSKQQRFPSKKYKEWLRLCPRLNPYKFDSVKIHYCYYFPEARSRDTENYIKCVSDYLVKESVLIDDNYNVIKEMTITPMGIDREKPRVEIFIYPC